MNLIASVRLLNSTQYPDYGMGRYGSFHSHPHPIGFMDYLPLVDDPQFNRQRFPVPISEFGCPRS
jgi:hypothetical protein